MPDKKSDLLQGTLDLLILKIVAQGPMHGYGIAQRILVTSKETLQIQQGSLYPALHRLQRRGLLKFEWVDSGNGPMAKLYSLTPAGRKAFAEEVSRWQRFTGAVSLVLES
jgi:PadR family transcriptional regulator PadR